jgi:predicted nucleic acid-binding protein
MLRHAVRLGAGEAASLAIARSRGLPLATDDRPARAAAAEDPSVLVISTAELMHRWVQERPPDEVRGALVAITGRAAFRPPSSDPLAEWWDDVISDA